MERPTHKIPLAAVLSTLLFTASLFVFGQTPSASTQVQLVAGISISIPAPWFLANRTTNALEVAYPLSGKPPQPPANRKPQSAEELTTADARIAITFETRTNHANAVERLAQIASEEPVRPQLLAIAGWPAIHRQLTKPLPQPGETDSPVSETGIVTTTAIAVNSLVVRFETALAPRANPALAQTALQIAQQVQVQPGNAQAAQLELQTLSQLISTQQPKHPTETPHHAASNPHATALLSAPGTSTVQSGIGELEVVISANQLHVVVAANSGFSYSDNAGATFTKGGPTPCIFNGCDGDPSLAIGKSGNVYYSWIGFPNKQPGGKPPNGITDSLSISNNNGHTFTFLSNAVVCPTATPAVCTLPDQEHIAADRKTSAKGGRDRVYLVWRNFSNVSLTPRIVCSVNGGQTWSAQTTIGTGDFPRITVGSDGFVYVVFTAGSNILVNKFSPCDAGLVQQTGFPSTVTSSYTLVACPVPGLDRCDNGNTLSSQMVAVDDTNPAHVFVTLATNTAPNNENILLYDSLDGGATWGSPVQLNQPVVGRRFMPWVCVAGGVASVTWYDRRAATPAADDLTAYYHGSGQRITPPGALEANPEINISGVNDPQCASGWPGGERSPGDAASCSTAQLAGHCQLPCANTAAGCPGGITGSNTPCFFANGPNLCTVPTETCQVWGGGSPKYGDYNGNACAELQIQPGGPRVPAICNVWASATRPKGVAEAAKGIQIYASCSSIDSTAPPVTITYHQTGACNGYANASGLVSAGSNFAYVLFGIESIDNSFGATPFNFNPANLFVQQATQDPFDPGLQLYTDILGPFAAVATTVAAGFDLKFSVSAQGALIVSTTNPDGAVEADATSYILLYNRQPGDPPVKLVKSDASQTSWPLTEDCSAIHLH